MSSGPSRLLELSTRSVPLEVVRNPRARRLALRVDPASGQVRLVLPRRASLGEGLDFARRHGGWLEKQLAAVPDRIPFEDGCVVPILGRDHLIRHRPEARRGVWLEDGLVLVSGRTAHVARRVEDFLRRAAHREITARSHDKARKIERAIKRIVLRDTRTRWGSCSADGSLNYCWRLILAPEPVLDYVVAHEVAHLAHRNHGERFWSLVAQLTPEVTGPRRWLREQGHLLHRYG